MSGQSAVNPTRKLHDAAVVYLYDGSFEGFLCCVFESFAQHEIPFAVWTPERETATLYPFKDIATDHEKARRVLPALAGNWGPRRNTSSRGTSSPAGRDKELLLIRFLHLAFALGRVRSSGQATGRRAALRDEKRASTGRWTNFEGFVRFEEHDGMLGAVIHPKNYILPLLRGHFCGRFPEEDFMIYDAVHQAVLLYRNHRPQLLELAEPWSFPRPASGSSSFRRSGSSFTKRWRSRPATTSGAA